MSARTVVVLGYETSNNLKVRLALAHKKIPHEFRTIDPKERAEVVRVSGQFLTPVLVHGETVLFDSAAILRYLDANFPGTPKLFGASHAEQWEIEDWERFGRGPLAEPMMTVVHTRVTGGEVGAEMVRRESEAFGRAMRTLEDRLEGRRFLVGGALSAADITCAAVMHRVRRTGVVPWPPGFDRCEELAGRVMGLLG